MLRAIFKKYILNFKTPAGTSRGVLENKPSWIIQIKDLKTNLTGIGECSIIPGLSIDDVSQIEDKISEACDKINNTGLPYPDFSDDFPSVRFGFETAFLDLNSGGKRILFPSDFTNGKGSININGLIWMGNQMTMISQIREKVKSGFSCIKIKIGAIDFEKELEILSFIRKEFPNKELEIRVDANGAFSHDEAIEKIKALSVFNIHSIEQPIEAGQYGHMEIICRKSQIPVALDEELIGISIIQKKEKIISSIKPQYIVLKPGLLGGFKKSEEWISLANKYKLGWWITSALESDIGLNAISQWTYTLSNNLKQGLGTGKLFNNNFPSALEIQNGTLNYNPQFSYSWDNFFGNE